MGVCMCNNLTLIFLNDFFPPSLFGWITISASQIHGSFAAHSLLNLPFITISIPCPELILSCNKVKLQTNTSCKITLPEKYSSMDRRLSSKVYPTPIHNRVYKKTPKLFAISKQFASSQVKCRVRQPFSRVLFTV